MTLSDEAVQEFKGLMKKKYHQDLNDDEAREQGERLYSFIELLLEGAKKDFLRKKRLRKEPKGFHLDESEGVYNCIVCHESISGLETWWDEWGTKCMNCQINLDKGVVPKEICKNDDIWFKDWQLQSDFGIHPMTAKKMRREGKLIGRELKDKNGRTYFTVYLVEENKEFLKQVKWKKEGRANPLLVNKNGPVV